MADSLLSIDWDYFIDTGNEKVESYIENKRTINDLWYKRYLQGETQGENIQNHYHLSEELGTFWKEIKKHFQFNQDVKLYISDSHHLSYDLAKMYQCHDVYLFDAHSDLGYGGISSLDFEVNCANWLGHLLKNHEIEQAHIIYSPYTKEKPEYFKQINQLYDVKYVKQNQLPNNIKISVIHISRSGAWTPPWYDKKFIEFIKQLNLPYKVINCPIRKWNIKKLTYAQKLQYLMA